MLPDALAWLRGTEQWLRRYTISAGKMPALMKSRAQLYSTQLAKFRRALLAWYGSHARDLPWRRDHDPYRVWVSEIMLQQTRVAAVLQHYHEFLRRFPNIEKLAAARESSVLAAWSGLGYYRRARMMHAAAKVVVRDRAGEFPKTAEQLRALPGVGSYTSAAIASIAFGEPVAVVDGNVERVLERLSGERLSDEQLWQTADALLDRKRPGDFNQAMMELGATVCTPRAPACLTCPMTAQCSTRGELPNLRQTPKQKKRQVHYALDCRDGAVYLVQRPRKARLMPGMWELPEMAPRRNGHASEFRLRHSITVTDYTVLVERSTAPATARGQWISVEKLRSMPLTGLARKILRKADLISPAAVLS
jgi:A/G-specific adenine glycosylase